MKGKAVLSILLMLVTAVFMLGCGGGGGGSNPTGTDNSVGNATVSGIVNDLSGNPVSGASVRMVLSSNALMSAVTGNNKLASARAAVANRMSAVAQTEFNGVTNQEGRYTFTGVPEGDYTLSAVTQDGAQIISNLSVRAAEVTAPEMQLRPIGTVSGQVTLNSVGVSGAIVYAKGTSYAAITDASGNYTMTGVPASTTLTLCVQSSEGTAAEQNVAITDLKTRTVTASTFVLTPITSKACSLEVALTGASDISMTKCVVFAFCSDGTTYMAPCKTTGSGSSVSNKCSFKITHAGKYCLFPAYYDNDIVSLASTPATDSVDITDSSIQNAQTLTKSFALTAATSGFGSVEGKISASASGDYKLVLLDKAGNQYKQFLSAGSSFVFDNLCSSDTDYYTLVVYNDTKLYVRQTISFEENKKLSLGEITPVVVTPTIKNAGNGTVDFTPGELKNAVDTTSTVDPTFIKIKYLPLAHNSDNDTYNKLYTIADDDNKTVLYEFTASEAKTLTLNTDQCSTSSKGNLACFKLSVTIDNANPIEIATFESYADLGSDLWKTVALNGLTKDSNIIYFKMISYDDGATINYLVVTTTSASIYGADGTKKSSKDLPGKPIGVGNVYFIESDGGNPNRLLVQYYQTANSVSSTHGPSIVFKTAQITENSIADFDSTSYTYDSKVSNDSDYYVYSPNKIHATYVDMASTTIKVACAFDKSFSVFYLSPNYGTTTMINGRDFRDNGNSAVASCSSLIYVCDSNYYDFYFLTYDDGLVGLSKQSFNVDGSYSSNTVVRNLYNKTFINLDPDAGLYSCGGYKVYGLTSRSDFPFLTASMNLDKEAQALVYSDSDSKQVTCMYDDENSVYSDNKITTSAIFEGFNRYCIERTSSSQFLKGYSTLTGEEFQKIGINQVYNSNSYLEDSIGFLQLPVSTYTHDQYHLLCADNSGNIKVMIVNNFYIE